MPKIVSVKVDYSKIEKLMEINGLSNIQLEHALGHTDGFLRHVKNRETLTLSDYNLVKALYGMDVKATEEPKSYIGTKLLNLLNLPIMNRSVHLRR